MNELGDPVSRFEQTVDIKGLTKEMNELGYPVSRFEQTVDIKGLTKEMNELGDPVSRFEQTSDAQGEELDAYPCEILEFQDKNPELQYQVEDLENRSRRANIRIKGVPLQAARGNLKECVRKLFHLIVLELSPIEIALNRTHRTGRTAASPRHFHYYRQKETIMAAHRL
ncbi:hypothetical protein NDU88_007673 [Pleurodeles waltl]|uniref:Uncharacterized protein n=1 Tax=Pleurodeles waltl TaxID=8319 RepID=A0AAV7N621_PLEWA|nr:hypothetical protein NDU88_007673 [Pleurodeles waltl]